MRVAALLPAATDIVIALGAGDQLVAVTHACTLPARLAHIPRVTRSNVPSADAATIDHAVTDLSSAGAPLFGLDAERLIALQPDVLLTQAVCEVCAVREEDARAVASRMRHAPLILSLGADSVEGVLADIGAVAGALEIPEEGEELVAGLRSRIAAIHRTLKAAKAPRPGVLVLEWTDPPFSAGHWVPDVVGRAGGVELFADVGQRSRRLADEEPRGRDPEVIVVAPCGYGLADATREAESLAPAERSAWMRGRPLWAIDANHLVSSPGPGVVRGIEVFARMLHPQLFGPPSSLDAVRIA